MATPRITQFLHAKQQGTPLALLTAYDYTTAQLLNATPVDALLVGDSLAMTMLGHPNTLQVTVPDLLPFVRAVATGAPDKWVIADMPFMSYHISVEHTMAQAGQLMQQGLAHSVKLEGAAPLTLQIVERLTQSGIPVMGHLGLTPQAVHALGGFTVQAKTQQASQQLLTDALALQAAGCYAVVLECVPPDVAAHVTQELAVPTIGIGAGPQCNGQILVIDDMLGRTPHHAKFVRVFQPVGGYTQQAVTAYCQAVQQGTYPDLQTESYKPLNDIATISG
jgi:3-methyl-2-oxobutanoate hydroxymethyltransferase